MSANAMPKWNYSSILFPTCFVLGLAGVSYAQATGYADQLADYVLFRGRIVLSSGDLVYPTGDPTRNGAAAAVLDGDPESPAILSFPATHPHGTFLLIDTALTHSPAGFIAAIPDDLSSGETSRTANPTITAKQPASRQPVALKIYNGACHACDRNDFQRYGRIKRARIEILHRRANNPDEEFLIPRARPIWERTVDFPDASGPLSISLADLPTPPSSQAWPEQMQYIITHIQVLEIYPGTDFPDRFALGEVVYQDRAGPGEPIFAYQAIAVNHDAR